MFAAWIAFPLVLWLICLGCGLLIRFLTRADIGTVMLAPLGFATLILIGELASVFSFTAELTAPAATAAAIAGVLLSRPSTPRRWDPWAIAAPLAVFAVYAAPIVLSGEPTFSGYIKLDDTSTFLAITDRIAGHGRDLSGLAPSTYEATLAVNLGSGYPIGAFLPLAVGTSLIGRDAAWLFQPYMAVLGLLLAQCLYGLSGTLGLSRPLRAAVAFVAAQPALLFGYYLWGGVKEIAAALLLATLAMLVPTALQGWRSWRMTLPAGIAAAALVALLSAGGAALWLVPMLLIAGAAGIASQGLRRTAVAAGGLVLFAGAVAAPWLIDGGLLPRDSTSLADPRELGNLLGPLKLWQAWGIWPAGDFRHTPSDSFVTAALIAIAIGAAAIGGVFIWRRRALAPGVFVASLIIGAAALILIGSPWVDGKALATVSPALLFLAVLGAAVLITRGLRIEGAIVMAAIAAGVMWSNAMAYRDVWLAPFDRLSELQAIGTRIAGQGPTLLTSYEPYAVRHFLRDADPEGAAELRRRTVPLRNGDVLHESEFADIDDFALDGLQVYRTLVLRRSPDASRPPLPFQLVFRDQNWEIWQQQGSAKPLDHLPLGTDSEPTAVPSCAAIMSLAAKQGATELAASERPNPMLIPISDLSLPPGWRLDAPGASVVFPERSGVASGNIQVPEDGRYGLWIGGSDHGEVEVRIDGKSVGAETRILDHVGQYRELGTAKLSGGTHRIALSYDRGGPAPGANEDPSAIGPIALSTATGADSRLLTVPLPDAASLCGRPLDWVEAVSG